MATLDGLVQGGHLTLLEVPLDDGVCAWRRIYGTSAVVGWLCDILPGLASTMVGVQMSPLEQVDELFNYYISGGEINDDRRFKPLHCKDPATFIWEMKTDEIRIIGWVPERDAFVCTFADMKDEIVIYKKYQRYIAQTHFIRSRLPLDHPKCVESKEIRDVVSTPN